MSLLARWEPKEPFRAKSVMALEIVVFYCSPSVLLAVLRCCCSSREKHLQRQCHSELLWPQGFATRGVLVWRGPLSNGEDKLDPPCFVGILLNMASLHTLINGHLALQSSP